MTGERIRVSIGAALFYPALYFLDSAGWFSALVPAIVFHEAGHWLALRRCGARILRLQVDITGLCMDTTTLYSRRQEAVCAAAGPAAGLFWAGIAALMESRWGQMCAGVSLMLTLFNLLPVLPLDGGRILLALTGSEKLLDQLGCIVPLLLAVGALLWDAYGLLIPAALIVYGRFTS